MTDRATPRIGHPARLTLGSAEATVREREVRDQYERWLSGWSPVALYVRWYLRHAGAHYARPLFAAMGNQPFPRVLDVGCATGFYLEWALRHGLGCEHAAGVDVSPALLAEAKARLEPARLSGAHITLAESSATSLPFADGSFDAVICNGVIKYLDDDQLRAFLGEAHRVLAPEGRLAIADFGRPVPWQAALFPPDRFGIPTRHLRTAAVQVAALCTQGFADVHTVPLTRLRRIPLTYEGAVGTRT